MKSMKKILIKNIAKEKESKKKNGDKI